MSSSNKPPAKGLQTAPDKRGKIKNCTPGKSFPCGKACLSIGSYLLQQCLKKLNSESVSKAQELGHHLTGSKSAVTIKPIASGQSQKVLKAQIVTRVKALVKQTDEFKDIINSINDDLIKNKNVSDASKAAVITSAKEIIDKTYQILKDDNGGIEAFYIPTADRSDDEQHNIIDSPFKVRDLVGEIGVVPFANENRLNLSAFMHIDMSDDLELKNKVQFIKNSFAGTNKQTVNYDGAIESIAKHANVSKEKAGEMMKSVQKFTLNGYYDIRMADRGIPNVNPESVQDAANINEFLTRFKPKYKGTLYRGMIVHPDVQKKIIKELEEGTLVNPAMSSFSTDEKVVQEFAYPVSALEIDPNLEDETVGIVLVVSNSSTGVSVRNISNIPQEDEVLVPRGVKIKMAGKPYMKDGVTYLPVEEI